MLDQKLFELIVGKYGFFGLLILWICYLTMKYGNVWWKKFNGEYVSYKDLKEKIEGLEDQMKVQMETTTDLKLLRQTQELKNSFIEDKVENIQSSIKELNASVNELKNLLLQKWNG